MSESGWHWDEQRALRELLSEQAEAHAGEIAYWRDRAERAEMRERNALRLLVLALADPNR